MTKSNVNSGSLDDSRNRRIESNELSLFLDELWEMSQDVSIEEIRLACVDARKLALSSKEDCKLWRSIMDNLFTIFIERINA